MKTQPTNTVPKKPQVPLSSFSNKNWIMLGVAAIIVALISSGTTYLILQSGSKNPPQAQTTQPTGYLSPTQSKPDETANWKTYTSKEYIFKYPSDWEENKNIESGGPMFRPIDKSSICNIQLIGPTKVGSSVPLEDTYKIAGGTLLSRDEITIDGYKAIKQAYYTNSNGLLHREVIVKDPLSPPSTSVAGDILTPILLNALSGITTNDKNDQRCNQVFDQILSTFQFSN